jgi:hypothetical protein
VDELFPRESESFRTGGRISGILSLLSTEKGPIVLIDSSIIISPDSFMAGLRPMTLLIPSVHAKALPAVCMRLHGNTLNTHFELVWQSVCSMLVSA